MLQWANLTTRIGLYRDTKAGWIAGVCAGIAERAAIKPFWIRLGFALVTAVTHGFFLIAYFALAFLMKPRPGAEAPASASGAQMAYRDLAQTVTSPFAAGGRQVNDLKARFAALDARLNGLEAAVLTDELSLRRKFRDIGG
jgi:phage shock protein C